MASGAGFIIYHIPVAAQLIAIYLRNGEHLRTTFDEVKQEVIRAGPSSIMVKRDLKDAFRHILVSSQDWWLLGFS